MSLTSATTLRAHLPASAGRTARLGALAGIGGGGAMLLTGMLVARASGLSVWQAPLQIAAWLDPSVRQSNPIALAGPVLLGLGLHLLVAALLGALFALARHDWFRLPSDYGAPLVAGLAYGLLIWAAAYLVILPGVDRWLLVGYAPAFLIQHLVYGTALGALNAWLHPTPYRASAAA